MRHILTFIALVLGLLPLWAQGQAIIVPPNRIPFPGTYAVESVTLDATIKDQVAEVQLGQVFRNLSGRDLEVQCLVPVPADAAISQFVLMVDGKELPAKLYTKEEANRIYESIVRSKRDPALLQFMGHGLLQTNVFPLPPNAQRKITLRYTQICRRDREVTELLLPLTGSKLSSKPIENLTITARIDSPAAIKSVYSPAHSLAIERPGDSSAIVRFSQSHVVPADDFRVLWSLSEQPIGATLLSYRPIENEDGYFLLLASPQVKGSEAQIARKTVVFALDRSGSMAGQKIEQAKNALKFVLNNLRQGDSFNLIAYDDRVESFKPELQRFDEQTRAEALRWIDSIHDGGSTNIDGALSRAMELIGDTGRPSYVIFLTDGLPTSGQTNESAIAANAKAANRNKARLFAFGVGFDVNARLLDRLATDNSGTSEYVRPNDNIEASVARFYGRMTAPVLTEVKLELPGVEISRVYPSVLPDLFAGGQIIAVGRYHTPGPSNIRLLGKVGDIEQTFSFPASLVSKSADETYGFVEKLWATRRVGEIINELDLKGRNQELIDELVRLSTRHGILTPYTAFLADERTNLGALSANTRLAEEYAFQAKDSALGLNTTGAKAVHLRAAKASLQQQAQAVAGAQGYADADGAWRQIDQLQVVGNKALYRRSNRWIDPAVTPEEEKSAEQVEQFSEKFFELARNNARLRQYLALPEGCTVRIDGRVYQINAPRG